MKRMMMENGAVELDVASQLAVSEQELLVGWTDSNECRNALYVWLQGKPANTRRSYMRGILDFFTYFGEFTPPKVTAQYVANYKEHLKSLGRSHATVVQRLAALSSYYNYLVASHLVAENPVLLAGRDDVKVSPYGRSRKVSAADFMRMLDTIDTSTTVGAMYHAIFLWYFLDARRRAEVLRMTGQDIRVEGGRVTCRVVVKGGDETWRELPPPVWMAIQHYLKLAGREMRDDEPIFQATVDNAKWLHPELAAEPRQLSDSAVSQALKRYATAAGLDADKISIHSLRHLGGLEYYKASGKDVEATRRFLGHSSLATTTIYLSQMDGQEHRHWQAMMNQLAAAAVEV